MNDTAIKGGHPERGLEARAATRTQTCAKVVASDRLHRVRKPQKRQESECYHTGDNPVRRDSRFVVFQVDPLQACDDCRRAECKAQEVQACRRAEGEDASPSRQKRVLHQSQRAQPRFSENPKDYDDANSQSLRQCCAKGRSGDPHTPQSDQHVIESHVRHGHEQAQSGHESHETFVPQRIGVDGKYEGQRGCEDRDAQIDPTQLCKVLRAASSQFGSRFSKGEEQGDERGACTKSETVGTGKDGAGFVQAPRAEMARENARHARRDERGKRYDDHIWREHQCDRGKGFGPSEVAQKKRVYDGQQSVHAHHEDDRQRSFQVERAKWPGQKSVSKGRHDPVLLLAIVTQVWTGPAFPSARLVPRMKKMVSMSELYRDRTSAGGRRLMPERVVRWIARYCQATRISGGEPLDKPVTWPSPVCGDRLTKSVTAGPVQGKTRRRHPISLSSVYATCWVCRNRPVRRIFNAFCIIQSMASPAVFSAQKVRNSAPLGRSTRHSSRSASAGFAVVSSAQAQVTTSKVSGAKGKASRLPWRLQTGISAHCANMAAEASISVICSGAMPSLIKVRANRPVPQPASSSVEPGVMATRTAASKAACASPPANLSQRLCSAS